MGIAKMKASLKAHLESADCVYLWITRWITQLPGDSPFSIPNISHIFIHLVHRLSPPIYSAVNRLSPGGLY